MSDFVPTDLRWRKSARSAVSGNCVEVAGGDNGFVYVRDSKNPRAGVLVFDAADFATFIAAIKVGELIALR
ncbi:hypothetical protein GCM10010435_58030 [Winogradskya consettensis]|uniref:DUF397 domain-containing protein n=1 Tax=Winogradskya consettensis TaxID=113560 RepID=A0A919S925_9ACTN|nr:DUF397 domain-containing protein [Actinoplanes consettensis]GIM66987.1 hypothetical protein Aco04nite_04290 [Actinoplanes consettensis]